MQVVCMILSDCCHQNSIARNDYLS